MKKDFKVRVQTSLQEKRNNLETWLETASQPEKQCCLEQAGEQHVVDQLSVIDRAIEKVEDETLGICSICHGHVEDEVLEINYTACVCLDDLSDQERRELETELEFSTEIQRALLPQQVPSIPGLEIAAFSRPASIVSGDYFDFFQFKGGSPGFVIADVAGHGFSASLLMSSLQTALQTLAMDNASVTDVVRRINQYYLHNINLTTFITLFLGEYDPNQQLLTYTNAGHNPPLLLRQPAGGKASVNWLNPTAAAIGLVEEYKVRSEQVTLQQYDMLLLYTDGVTELNSPNQEEFGKERLAGLVAQNAGGSAPDLLSAIRKELDAFSGGKPPTDDLTIIAVRVIAQ